MATDFLRLTIQIEPAEEGGFVSYCPELDVASQGESLDEALAHAKEAIQVYLEALSDLGDLDRIIRERNLHLVSTPDETANVQVTTGQVVSSLVALLSGGKVSV